MVVVVIIIIIINTKKCFSKLGKGKIIEAE